MLSDDRSINCSEILERYSDYIDGYLPEPRIVEFQRHLEECPRCGGYHAILVGAADALRAQPQIAPAEDFQARLEHRLLHLREGGRALPGQARRGLSGALAPTAAAVAVFGLGLAAMARFGLWGGDLRLAGGPVARAPVAAAPEESGAPAAAEGVRGPHGVPAGDVSLDFGRRLVELAASGQAPAEGSGPSGGLASISTIGELPPPIPALSAAAGAEFVLAGASMPAFGRDPRVHVGTGGRGLGIIVQEIADPAEEGGLCIQGVRRMSAAYFAGLRPGDVILTFDGQRVDTADELFHLVQQVRWRDVPVRIEREGQLLEVMVRL